jgi:hypothetical protein
MAQALYFSGHNKGFDPIEAAGWQARQVSIISLMNFSGRIFIGTSPFPLSPSFHQYFLSLTLTPLTRPRLRCLQTPTLLSAFLLSRPRLIVLPRLADRSRHRGRYPTPLDG